MSKLLIANWKMNPTSLKEANKLLSGVLLKPPVKGVEVVICPPAPYLAALKILRQGELGAQNVFWEEKGAYTGEYSPAMLKSLGVRYVILGHSERREYLKETDQMINKKVIAALRAGLRVVLCVGESWEIRKKGFVPSTYFVKNQLMKSLEKVEDLKSSLKNIIIAYEPIWAISTSKDKRKETGEDAARMSAFIKNTLRGKFFGLTPRVLYGGSVDSKNIVSFLKYDEIDGALVGGASLRLGDFKKIIEKAGRLA